MGFGWRAVALAGVSAPILAGCGGADMVSAPSQTLQGLTLDTVFAIGAADGETWEAFEGIWEVEASPAGYVAVLDIGSSQVHVYDAAGLHVGSVLDSGLDAGALSGPDGLAWRSGSELLVWDPGSSWVSEFTVGPQGIEFVDRQRAFAFGETGFCAAGERTYLSYWQSGVVVHELGPDGPSNSFGPAPDIPGVETLGPELQEIAIEELTPSALLCAPGGVLDVSAFGSQLRMHSADGELLWSRDADDFNPLVVFTPDGMGLGRQFDENEGTHLFESVVGWGEEMALVQHELLRREFPEVGEVPVIESRLIRLADGEEVDRTRDLPQIAATWGQRIYAIRDEPFPQVLAIEVVASEQ